jgi:hypothetical protein
MAPERYKAVTQKPSVPPFFSSPPFLCPTDHSITLSSFGSLLDELPDWLPEARFSTLRLDAGRHDFSDGALPEPRVPRARGARPVAHRHRHARWPPRGKKIRRR